MALKLSNNAVSTLAASITAAATTLSVQSADAGKFPVLGAGDWCPATIIDSANNMEIVRVTARAGATLTITRAQEGTTAKAFAAGSRIDVRLTAETVASIVQKINDDVATLNSAIAQRMQKSGDTMTGALQTPRVHVDGDAGSDRLVAFRTGTSARFIMTVNGSAESGSNIGSDFCIYRYNDAGNYIGTAFSIARNSGEAAVYGNFVVTNDVFVSGTAYLGRNGGGLELGATNGTSQVSFIDFHTSATVVDYNARIIADGNGGTGQANINVVAGRLLFNGIDVVSRSDKATVADIIAGTANKFTDAEAIKNAFAPFLSGQQTIVAGGNIVVAHGLGTVPGDVEIRLVCTTADAGYSVGDTLLFHSAVDTNSNSSYGLQVLMDATNVAVLIGASGLAVYNKSTKVVNVITLANWRIVVRATR